MPPTQFRSTSTIEKRIRFAVLERSLLHGMFKGGFWWNIGLFEGFTGLDSSISAYFLHLILVLFHIAYRKQSKDHQVLRQA